MILRRFVTIFPIIFILLGAIYAQPIDWAFPYAKYRLVYKFTLDSDANDVYVNITIPTDVIDNVLSYCQVLSKSYCDEAYPLVYYYNSTSNSQVSVTQQVTYVETYNGYPSKIRVHFDSLPAGTHYIVLYYPYIWTDTFDDNPTTSVSNTGDCLQDGWCIAYKNVGASLGVDENKRLYLHCSYTSSTHSMCLVERVINIPVTKEYPILLHIAASYNTYGTDSTRVAGYLLINATLTDGSNAILAYTVYKGSSAPLAFPPGVSYCSIKYLGSGEKVIDILNDFSQYCGIPVEKISKIHSIYLYNLAQRYYSPGTIYLDDVYFMSKYE